ncbi:ABC transporter substrate-binding protein [Melittangium boletus]|uniref:Nitrate ABC transporter substrate-binding protein n=1 Tax=Melittangium boletus DSM 14713 TaxID=1294270 RepID=A0A250IE41_9BACT|nr:ABC transporter substrate-binding protein [Melittangium boletus]ATB29397.1 hypothetical protein MEBOL_002846 [Melittangium boletus DSM 14713]
MRSIGLTAALLLLLSACTRVPDRPLKVGTHPWAGSEPLYLARQLDLYPPQSIHLVEFTNTHQLARAFRNGVIDAAAVPLIEALRFESMGQSPRVVLMLDSSRGANCLIARAEVASLAALKNKRVAHAGGTTTKYLLARLAERGGLVTEDLHEVILPEEAQELALQEKQEEKGWVDAVLTSAPHCAKLLANGATHQLFASAQLPDEFIDVLVVRQEALDSHPPRQVELLLRGWFAALNHSAAHPRNAAERMAPRLGLDAERFQQALGDIHLADAHEQRLHLMGPSPRLRATIERVGETMLRDQLLTEPPDAVALIHAEPLARVLP